MKKDFNQPCRPIVPTGTLKSSQFLPANGDDQPENPMDFIIRNGARECNTLMGQDSGVVKCV